MGAIAAFELGGETFALGRVIEAIPSVRVDLERVVPVDGGVLPYVWVRGDSADEFGRVAAEIDGIANARRVESFEDVTLYRLRWDPTMDQFITTIIDADGTVLEASGDVRGWRFELRFSERENLATFQTLCNERDIDVSVVKVHSLHELSEETYGLTAAQRETLTTAYHAGYFAEPRETTTEELARHFDVSSRALSGRIRRGTGRLLASTLVAHPDAEADGPTSSPRSGD
ncbi:helix-turn-helix domain-containing protein [Halogeometricum limi]|uniref:Predicted DNA binding protein, contains HTH domain n=1 Tax=Halogeometricum limi TaxID=555875 RepID=A0A1I6G469_9EURY|nr:bacterio-opsin activator domain-containing protein [Halogeometricum limi]SFR36910.1 Predicted DNA binding protein, contains HTH domain [Halogeometricum limi]